MESTYTSTEVLTSSSDKQNITSPTCPSTSSGVPDLGPQYTFTLPPCHFLLPGTPGLHHDATHPTNMTTTHPEYHCTLDDHRTLSDDIPELHTSMNMTTRQDSGTSEQQHSLQGPSKAKRRLAKPRVVYKRQNKPPYTYLGMVAAAILMSPDQRLTLSGIRSKLAEMFPFFRGEYNGWKDSVRHVVSRTPCFYKEPESTKVCGFWRVDLSKVPSDSFIRKAGYNTNYKYNLHEELGIPAHVLHGTAYNGVTKPSCYAPCVFSSTPMNKSVDSNVFDSLTTEDSNSALKHSISAILEERKPVSLLTDSPFCMESLRQNENPEDSLLPWRRSLISGTLATPDQTAYHGYDAIASASKPVSESEVAQHPSAYSSINQMFQSHVSDHASQMIDPAQFFQGMVYPNTGYGLPVTTAEYATYLPYPDYQSYLPYSQSENLNVSPVNQVYSKSDCKSFSEVL